MIIIKKIIFVCFSHISIKLYLIDIFKKNNWFRRHLQNWSMGMRVWDFQYFGYGTSFENVPKNVLLVSTHYLLIPIPPIHYLHIFIFVNRLFIREPINSLGDSPLTVVLSFHRSRSFPRIYLFNILASDIIDYISCSCLSMCVFLIEWGAICFLSRSRQHYRSANVVRYFTFARFKRDTYKTRYNSRYLL